ncbi:MAG: alpha/beta hydrolase [Pseudomonadales bacterium]|nr:alpha/beta hydrolase [Pseudomonadales bacterium]
MTFGEIRARLSALGREINPETIAGTRSVIAPLLTMAPGTDVQLTRDIHYGRHERQRFDLFTARGKNGRDGQRPVLVFVHGGGFVAGDKHMPGTPFYDNIGVWAVRNGFNGINMTYRLAPDHQWPSGVEDIRALLDFVGEQAPTLGIDAHNIFLMGQSAGAVHVASYIAHPELYAALPHGLRGAILVSGLYDFCTMAVSPLERAYLGNDESCYQERSSLKGLLKCDVPLMITVSEYDPCFFEAQALELLTAVQKKRLSLPRFVQLHGQNHMSSVLFIGLDGDQLGLALKDFIDETIDAGT